MSKHQDSPVQAGYLGEPNEDGNLDQVGYPLRELLEVTRVVTTGHSRLRQVPPLTKVGGRRQRESKKIKQRGLGERKVG